MILEHADIRIDPARAAEFEVAIVRGASTVIAHAKGFKGYKVNRSIESPGRYILMIYWQALEDHTVGFRESPAFAEWRAIVGPFFAQPPVVEHLELGFWCTACKRVRRIQEGDGSSKGPQGTMADALPVSKRNCFSMGCSG